MSPADSPAILVARFLRTNQYNETLDVFLQEAGLPPDTGITGKNDVTIEKVLEEKKTFDLSVRFEKLSTDEHDKAWSPSAPSATTTITTLPSKSNILNVSIQTFNDPGSSEKLCCILASTADRRLNVLDLASGDLHMSLTTLHDSPILSCAVLDESLLMTTSMSGHLVLSDRNGRIWDKRRDHAKYIVQIAVHQGLETSWVATAGWDAKVHLYKLQTEGLSTPKLDGPIGSLSLPSNPESMLFIRHPETAQPVLIITRRDSTFLYYYTVEAAPRLLGRQNLAPHSNAWVAFTPSAIALSPIDSSLLAVATSAVPHLKLLIVRLMVPPIDAPEPAQTTTASLPPTTVRGSLLDDPSALTAASQARAELALADREAAAIQIHCTTLAPQTAYSTPALAWRPDGTGVWVNSDDGVIRGIESRSGKIVSTLHGGHEVGSKIRCLCAGSVELGDGSVQEVLISGGFDQKLVVWRPSTTS